MNELYHSELMSYLAKLLPDRHPVIQEMESYAKETNFPIIGPVVGQFCYLITRMTGARRIFELGSGYGYSTAWFAMGVRDNGGGEVYHVVWHEDLSLKARDYLKRLELDSMVHFHVSEAVEQLQRTEGLFDIIFNDIDKQSYPGSVAVIEPKLHPGGILLVDNVLWHGAILNPSEHSPETVAIRQLNEMLFDHPCFDSTIIPLRDGVLMARKR
jgi:caffeoyl-CoA O-methyltransferase